MKQFTSALAILLLALAYLFIPPYFHDTEYRFALGEWAEIAMWTYLTVVMVICLIMVDEDKEADFDE